MLIEFKGGPCDGEILGLNVDPQDVIYLVARHHPERPVYRCSVCACCAAKEAVIEYRFVGYSSQMTRAQDRSSSDELLEAPEAAN